MALRKERKEGNSQCFPGWKGFRSTVSGELVYNHNKRRNRSDQTKTDSRCHAQEGLEIARAAEVRLG